MVKILFSFIRNKMMNLKSIFILTRSKILLFILFLGGIWKTLAQIEQSFACVNPGKFANPTDVHRYHQCFYLYGKLLYIDNICPSDTCFNEKLKYCVRESCPDYKPSRTTSFTDIDEVPSGPTSYDCATVKRIRCKKRGMFAHPQDHSVYVKCVKMFSKWTDLCFTCNKKHQTCFSNSLQACIPNDGKPCGKGKKTESPHHPIPIPHPPTVTFDCEGYSQYPCEILGHGVHGMPGDKSVYWYCGSASNGGNELVGVCSVCPERNCFIERKDMCIVNCGLGYAHKSYDCRTFKGSENYICKADGLFAFPEETSVFFNCNRKPNSTALMDAECFTCNRVKQTCFSDKQQACLVYNGDSCPMTDVLDGPNEDGAVKTPDESLSYDCTGYNFYSFPCAIYKEGVYEHPGDRSIYFECKKSKDGIWKAHCNACNEELNECFDWKVGKCSTFCGKKTPQPYNCDTFGDKNFNCTEAGYQSHPNDTSLYFGCWFPKEGETKSLCFTCNPKIGTCFDNKEKRCVTNSGRDTCGTSDDLDENDNKGTGENSLTYTCDGISKQSFPCYAYKEGYYALPGDPSVYVHCKRRKEGYKGDNEILSSFDTCHVCPEETRSCFDDKKGKCVDNCGTGGNSEESGEPPSPPPIPPTTTPPPPQPTPQPSPGSDSDEEPPAPPHPPPSPPTKNETGPPSPEPTQPPNPPLPGPGDSDEEPAPTALPPPQPPPPTTPTPTTTPSPPTGTGSPEPPPPPHPSPGDSDSEEGDEETTPTPSQKNETTAIDCPVFISKKDVCPPQIANHLFEEAARYYNCYNELDHHKWKGGCINCIGQKCSGIGPSPSPPPTKNCTGNCNGIKMSIEDVIDPLGPYDCSVFLEDSYPCTEEGKFPHPREDSIFFICKKSPKTNQLISLCYACNSASQSCFRKSLGRCVKDCIEAENDNESSDVETYGDNCRGYGFAAVPCAVIDRNKKVQSENNLTTGTKSKARDNFFYAHAGDPAVYFLCLDNANRWSAYCHLCPISTCFNEELQKCTAENCDEYKGDSDLGPYKPYDCRFYSLDAYPCTEEGVYSNPLHSSVYYHCKKVGSDLVAHCYSCNSELGTCFVQTKGACFKLNGTEGCGNQQKQIGVSVIGSPMTYQCAGYDPETSFPCHLLGAGKFGMPGDLSVYWACGWKDERSQFVGECKTCSKEEGACFDREKSTCVHDCVKQIFKPYDCTMYDNKESIFQCKSEGYFAQEFDSSIYFKCIQTGKKYKTECYTCNKFKKSCFSNKLQACITKGGKPCGYNDPSDSLMAGNEKGSRAYTCNGFQYQNFACSEYGKGNHPLKGDKSVFVTCQNSENSWQSATCTQCDWQSNSCYDVKKRKCVENCGKGIHKEYDCSTYDDKFYNCTREGLFANPKDTSIFFQCLKTGGSLGGFKSPCYTCNSFRKTCFDERLQSCIKSEDGRKCGPLMIAGGEKEEDGDEKEEDETIRTDSMAYECSGYSELAFPCAHYGTGKFAHPADKSVYFSCSIKGGEYVAECESCQKGWCYNDNEKICLQNCGRGPHQAYDCSEPYKFTCRKEGIFAGTIETSTFYECTKKPGGKKYEVKCYTCNKELGTCFSNRKQKCLLYDDKPCDSGDPADLDDSETLEIASRSYTCVGYGPKSFPCAKYPKGDTKYRHLGDLTIYFECKNGDDAICKSCPPENNAGFMPEEQKCVENCGKGPHQSYSCATYDETSFPCKDKGEGFYANPTDSSIFFKCIKVKKVWQAWCYTCSQTKLTCFSESQQACVTNNGRECMGGIDPYVENPNGGTEETSRSYSCTGYNKLSFPCAKFPKKKTAITHFHRGDRSVYFECLKKGDTFEAKCHACPKDNFSCYSPKTHECVENCYLGQHWPYDCGKYSFDSFPCSEEGGYFANPLDSATYYSCVKNRGVLMAYCFSCNRKMMTCFSNELQACVTVGSLSTQADGCGTVDPSTLPEAGNEESSRSYDCEGYFTSSFPCDRIRQPGKYAVPGDKSVYMECVQRDDGLWVAECHACSKSSNSCFFQNKQSCKENCGKKKPKNHKFKNPREAKIH